MQAHLCCVVSLLWCPMVLCLSRSRAVSERSDSLCCWRASLLLSLSYCRLSSLKRLLYLWTRSLAWRRHLSSKSSIVSWALAHQGGTCRRVRTLYVNSYTSVVNPLRTDIHTYKHNLRLRPHKRSPCPHDYVPHAKVFGNGYIYLLN